MATSLFDSIHLVHETFRHSTVLNRFGYPAGNCELTDESAVLDAGCRFTLEPSTQRKLVIHFYYRCDGNHYFTVEIRNTEIATSFLLEEWMSLRRISLQPYPFILSSYTGSVAERLTGFVAFLERMLCAEPIVSILMGRDWPDVPFDWGDVR